MIDQTVIDRDKIPEHFEPTSFGPRWQGKIKCKYCPASGWLNDDFTKPEKDRWPLWWGHNHGENCKGRQ